MRSVTINNQPLDIFLDQQQKAEILTVRQEEIKTKKQYQHISCRYSPQDKAPASPVKQYSPEEIKMENLKEFYQQREQELIDESGYEKPNRTKLVLAGLCTPEYQSMGQLQDRIKQLTGIIIPKNALAGKMTTLLKPSHNRPISHLIQANKIKGIHTYRVHPNASKIPLKTLQILSYRPSSGRSTISLRDVSIMDPELKAYLDARKMQKNISEQIQSDPKNTPKNNTPQETTPNESRQTPDQSPGEARLDHVVTVNVNFNFGPFKVSFQVDTE